MSDKLLYLPSDPDKQREQPDGVVVPREPTEAMLRAMSECYDPTWGYPDASVGIQGAEKSYAAMLEAASRREGQESTTRPQEDK